MELNSRKRWLWMIVPVTIIICAGSFVHLTIESDLGILDPDLKLSSSIAQMWTKTVASEYFGAVKEPTKDSTEAPEPTPTRVIENSSSGNREEAPNSSSALSSETGHGTSRNQGDKGEGTNSLESPTEAGSEEGKKSEAESISPGSEPSDSGIRAEASESAEPAQCDLFEGKWEADEQYPLYPQCRVVERSFDCKTNGRPSADYSRYRWKPNGCSLPPFNVTRFLEAIQGKHVMFVGDSMARQFFESLVCILTSAEPLGGSARVGGSAIPPFRKQGRFYRVHFQQPNATITYLWSRFLVRMHEHKFPSDMPRPNKWDHFVDVRRMDDWVKMAAEGDSGEEWLSSPAGPADILIFNAGPWFSWFTYRHYGMRFFTAEGKNYTKSDPQECFRAAMQKVRSELETHPRLSLLPAFFLDFPALHYTRGDPSKGYFNRNSKEWDYEGTCGNLSSLIHKEAELPAVDKRNMVLREIFGSHSRINLLRVSELTRPRADAHVGPFRPIRSKNEDCGHWCLPGVPDVWNELLYATMEKKGLLP